MEWKQNHAVAPGSKIRNRQERREKGKLEHRKKYLQILRKIHYVKTALGTRPSFDVIPGVNVALQRKFNGNSTKVPESGSI